jgi:C-22 sterol desaturase
MALNASFVSPTADAKAAHQVAQLDLNGVLSTLLSNVSGWTIVLTLILSCVAYDQCAFNNPSSRRHVD